MKEKPIKKIIIIGAGVSGLTSGIYAQKNGYISEIFERNATPGGLCTCWTRKGYTLDGCIHWLTGTRKGTQLYNIWKTIDAWDDEDIIRDDNFGTIEVDGKPITIWNDLDKLEKELIEIAPEDKKRIKKFTKLARRIVNVPLPYENSMSTMNFGGVILTGITMLPYLPTILYCLNTSARNYAKKFKSPYLKEFFGRILPGHKSNLYQMIYAYATGAAGNGGVPKKGSLHMAKRLADNYSREGGIIHYNSDIEEIIVKKGKAIGIKLKNGEIHHADYVISSADINHTMETLLKNKYHSYRFDLRFNKEHMYPSPSCVLASYSMDLEKYKQLGITSTYEFSVEPFVVGNTVENVLRTRTYNYDNYFIKDGRVVINVLCHQDDADYPFWKELNKNKPAYNQHKKELGLHIKELIENRFPTLKGDLELLDVVTPMTFVRYTNAYHGAYMCWGLTKDNILLLHNGKVRGVKNLVLGGQWLQMPGGLPIAIMTGKYAIDRINIKEGVIHSLKFIKPAKL